MSDPFSGLFTGNAAPSSSGDPFAGVFAQSNAHEKAVAIGKQAEQKQLKIHLANQRVQQAEKASAKQKSFFGRYTPAVVAGGAYDALVKPVVDSAKDAGTKAKQQFKYLASPTASATQQQSVVNNQKTVAKNPVTTKVINNAGNTSAAGKVQAEKMAVAGKSPNDVKKFLKTDATGLDTQTKTGVNAAINLSTTGAGIISAPETAARLAERLAGKKTAEKLINKTRVTAALNSKVPETTSNLGKTVVKEANTTHVPVVEPTETVGARTKVGSTAINNADRTSIPVKSYSSEAKGKVTTMDEPTYAKKAQQLSKDYDKESAQLRTVSNPQAQRVLQDRIDTKYSTAREALDNQAGKTSVSFTGKSKPTAQDLIVGKPVEAPVSAAEPKPVQVTTPGTKVAPGVSTKPITVTKPAVEAGELAPSGSALKTQAAAVEAGFKDEFPDTAKYRTGSYKQESENAAKLVNEDPTEAKQIAMGYKAGNNSIHEKMVYTAVKNKARAEGDGETLADLSSSSHHTDISESAQKLGATGYKADGNDPVRHIRVIKDERVKAFEKRTGKKLSTETKSVIKAAKSEIKSPTKDEWTSFVESLKC